MKDEKRQSKFRLAYIDELERKYDAGEITPTELKKEIYKLVATIEIDL